MCITYLYTRIMNKSCGSVSLDLVGRIQVIPKIRDHQDYNEASTDPWKHQRWNQVLRRSLLQTSSILFFFHHWALLSLRKNICILF